MKLLLVIAVLLFSCNGRPGDYSVKDFTVQLTFNDGTKDTFHVKSIRKPLLFKGDCIIAKDMGVFAMRDETIASGVRSIKFLDNVR